MCHMIPVPRFTHLDGGGEVSHRLRVATQARRASVVELDPRGLGDSVAHLKNEIDHLAGRVGAGELRVY